MKIEGIPDGWELVRVGKPTIGEYMVSYKGRPTEIDDEYCGLDAVVIRKIEKPKQYRPFANAAEFEPHRDRWVKQKLGNGDHRFKTQSYSNLMHYTNDEGETWDLAFDYFEFDDGTPFGVEVVE